jgi:HlyD family secretion protein
VTYKTILRVDNSALLLRPGMTATAEITVLKKTDAILVSNSALRFSPALEESPKKRKGGLVSMLLPGPPGSDSKLSGNPDSRKKEQNVWTVRDGRLVPVPIVKGDTDGNVTEVTGGALEPGTELVTEAISAP